MIRGPSGAGKSTLALRCLQAGFRLVADDRVVVWCSGGRPFGKAPGPLAGLIEVRGVGVVPAAQPLALVGIDLVVELVEAPDRLPEVETAMVAGAPVRRLGMLAGDPDLPLRLTAALAALQHGL